MREIVLQRESCAEEETEEVGEELARLLFPKGLVLLEGGLGAGKTVMVKGIAKALRINPQEVRSPTFNLINEYTCGTVPLYHMDFYRLENWSEVIDLQFFEYVEREGIVAVEWGDKFLSLFPPPFLFVSILIGGEKERKITVERWSE